LCKPHRREALVIASFREKTAQKTNRMKVFHTIFYDFVKPINTIDAMPCSGNYKAVSHDVRHPAILPLHRDVYTA
jgi:hypothetical protein